MIKLVKFSRQTNFTGRNGFGKCSGIEAMYLEHDKNVLFTALTGKGVPARCDIYIPAESVVSVISALSEIASGVNQDNRPDFQINISGSGSPKEIAESLLAVAQNMLSIPDEELCDSEWEDAILMTEVFMVEAKPKSVNEKKNRAIHQIIGQFFLVDSESEAVDTYKELKAFVKEDKYLCAVHAFENIAQPFEDMVLSTLLEIVEAGIECILAGGQSGS